MFSLNSEQKQAVGLLSIGTFLEYFDLMLYIHMAVLLNELFFPKTDPHTANLLIAFAFCSISIFRPIGALIFGKIGDNLGRKATVVITTMLMAMSCIIMANLPTYAELGITASWIVIVCRMVQGMSSVGEIVGAELYLTETVKPPVSYQTIALIGVSAALGGTAALGIASLSTYLLFNWRIAFWIGAAIALVGTFARITLRETPEFVDARSRIKDTFKKSQQDPKLLENNPIYNEKVNKTTVLALFLIYCTYPACFYFSYMYCANILKTSFGYSTGQVIHQNFLVSLSELSMLLVLVYLTGKIPPLKILKILIAIFAVFILVCPYLLYNSKTPFDLLLIQSFAILFAPILMPAIPIFVKYFPVFKRFTYVGVTYAFSRTLIYIITSFGFIYLVEYIGHWGLLIIMIPTTLGFVFGLSHFEKLEKAAGNYYNKKNADSPDEVGSVR